MARPNDTQYNDNGNATTLGHPCRTHAFVRECAHRTRHIRVWSPEGVALALFSSIYNRFFAYRCHQAHRCALSAPRNRCVCTPLCHISLVLLFLFRRHLVYTTAQDLYNVNQRINKVYLLVVIYHIFGYGPAHVNIRFCGIF